MEREGQVWGMGGLAGRITCTALARAASWACRGHGAQGRKATLLRGVGYQGLGRSRSRPGSHSVLEAELGPS